MLQAEVAICGGGIAGLSAGYHLPDRHVIFEKSSRPGGLAGSVWKDGFVFDYTGHLLHLRDKYAMKLVLGLLGDNVQLHHRKAWIYSHNTFTRYPYQANLYGLPQEVVGECVRGFIRCNSQEQRKFNPRDSFAEWVIDTFGVGFAKHFFFPYNRKLWQVDPTDMTCEWVGQFVPRPTVEDVLNGVTEDSLKSFGYNAAFYYPKRGGVQALSDAFVNTGMVNIKTDTTVSGINLKRKIITLSSKNAVYPCKYQHLINTLPLPHFLKKIEDLPPLISGTIPKLQWTSVLNVNVGVQGKDPSNGKHWIYFPEEKFPFYRVGFPGNFSEASTPPDCYSMYVEVAYPAKSLPTGKEEAEMIFRCLDGLKACDLLSSAEAIRTIQVNPIPIAYVIYDKYRTPLVTNILSFLQEHDIFSIGRYGKWQYSFIEAGILEGKEAATVILSNKKTSLNP